MRLVLECQAGENIGGGKRERSSPWITQWDIRTQQPSIEYHGSY